MLIDRVGRERVEIVVGAATVAFGKALGALVAALIVYAVVAVAVGSVVIVGAVR